MSKFLDITPERATVIWRWLITGLVLLLYVLLAFSWASNRSYATQLKETRDREIALYETSRASCERLNIERNRVNDLAFAVWRSFRSAAARERRLAQGPTAGTHANSAKTFRSYAWQVRSVPLTDCDGATLHPRTFRAPEPEHFTDGH